MDRRRLHPLEVFKRKHDLSYAKLAGLFRDRGWPISSKGVRYIAVKERRPSWELCQFIASKILDDGTSAQQLRDWAPTPAQAAA